MADIKKIKLGGVSYDIWANGVDASAISGQIFESAISSVPESAIKSIPESAIKSVPWSSVSGLTGAVSTATTSGFAAASAVAKAIDDQIATVYKVKGNSTFVGLPTDAKNGDVYNLTTSGTTGEGTTKEDFFVGDNVVWVTAAGGGKWDKLAASVSLDGYATTAWTTGYINSGVNSGNATALWNDVTAYVNPTVTAVTDNSANWNSAYTWVTTNGDNVSASATSGAEASAWINDNKDKLLTAVTTTGYVSGDGTADSKIGLTNIASGAIDAVTGAVTTSADMAAAGNAGKLAQVGAITGYIDEKIAETVAETIDIANDPIYTKNDQGKYTITAALSAIPNVGAVTGYVDNRYIAKTDIYYGGETGNNAYTLIIGNT